MFRFLLTVTSLALAVTLAFAPSAHAKRGKGTAIVLNLHGTGQAYPGTVPDIDGDGEDEPADCFDVDLINLETGKVVGGGTDCLANVNPGVNGGLEVVGTTYFHLPEGTLISRGLTTVQPVNHGSPGYTHITGAMPSGTGLWQGWVFQRCPAPNIW